MVKSIESEADVRRWVRRASGGRARWVEPASGSTPGLPDCWVPYPLQKPIGSVHLELKCGELEGLRLRYKVRPEQKREIKAMLQDGQKVALLVGIKGTHACVFLPPLQRILAGSAVIEGGRWPVGDIRTDSSFWEGVISIV